MAMAHRVCPWWAGYLLASPIRRLLHDPRKIVAPYVRQGMKVLEPGPGMGFFTLELARMVGPSGRVVAVDVQRQMVDRLKRRAYKAGLLDRVDARLATSDSLGVTDLRGTVDFALAFAVVHEMPSANAFFAQAAEALKPGGALLLAEPSGHVSGETFEAELESAEGAGLKRGEDLEIRHSLAVLLKK